MKTLQDLIQALKQVRPDDTSELDLCLADIEFSQIMSAQLQSLLPIAHLSLEILLKQDKNGARLLQYIFQCFLKDRHAGVVDKLQLFGPIFGLLFENLKPKMLHVPVRMYYAIHYACQLQVNNDKQQEHLFERALALLLSELNAHIAGNNDLDADLKTHYQQLLSNAPRFLGVYQYLVKRGQQSCDNDFLLRLEDFMARQQTWDDGYTRFNGRLATSQYVKHCKQLAELEDEMRIAVIKAGREAMNLFLLQYDDLPEHVFHRFVTQHLLEYANEGKDPNALLKAVKAVRAQMPAGKGFSAYLFEVEATYFAVDAIFFDRSVVRPFGDIYLAADLHDAATQEVALAEVSQRLGSSRNGLWFLHAWNLVKRKNATLNHALANLLMATEYKAAGLFGPVTKTVAPIAAQAVETQPSWHAHWNFAELIKRMIKEGLGEQVVAILSRSAIREQTLLSALINSTYSFRLPVLLGVLSRGLEQNNLNPEHVIALLNTQPQGTQSFLMKMARKGQFSEVLPLLQAIPSDYAGFLYEPLMYLAPIGGKVYIQGTAERNPPLHSALSLALNHKSSQADVLLFMEQLLRDAVPEDQIEGTQKISYQVIADMLNRVNLIGHLPYMSEESITKTYDLIELLAQNNVDISSFFTKDVTHHIANKCPNLLGKLVDLLQQSAPRLISLQSLHDALMGLAPHMLIEREGNVRSTFLTILRDLIFCPRSNLELIEHYEPFIKQMSYPSEPPSQWQDLLMDMKMLKLHYYFETRAMKGIDADFAKRLIDFFQQILSWSGDSHKKLRGFGRSHHYADCMESLADLPQSQRNQLLLKLAAFIKQRLTTSYRSLKTQQYIYLFTALIALNAFSESAGRPTTLEMSKYGQFFQPVEESPKAEAVTPIRYQRPESMPADKFDALDPVQKICFSDLDDNACALALLYVFGDLIANTYDREDVFPNVRAFFETAATSPDDGPEQLPLCALFHAKLAEPGFLTEVLDLRDDQAQLQSVFGGLAVLKVWWRGGPELPDIQAQFGPGGIHELQ